MEKDCKVFESFGALDTFRIGKALAEESTPGQVYCLHGDLGTGKTVFSQGFGKGLGVEEQISSPTFTILKEYHDGRFPFYHFDVYRIGSEDEMDEIGYQDIVCGDGVCLIEWAELIRDIIPEDCIDIVITKNVEKGFDYRRIEIKR
ncbi:MAG: tRNA (adenosine(37)-N6)-threonylcarbamoyltransferase complex ATPase subunit type 1 TsaE [Clostridium sp.]|nr:tRNA (adenosine(37)-N6)-threonylcarbamoyltransferase complex ATPase subunit type 1 TsaE [Clostridium sp.]MCM1399150.1 tRNA (adenosine(37)-N6)-threonylcarbamoyltransferase complex ATPase subunit type 1 TsaE [Clostridium sp.]MCM1459542.1 tRNA (adenosine(37)-N6)-threonylcarbamoyltransferase complex ATPase subunit type 1 TsaE [Bacteroides sp.]